VAKTPPSCLDNSAAKAASILNKTRSQTFLQHTRIYATYDFGRMGYVNILYIKKPS
jgi:hypothetical protein